MKNLQNFFFSVIRQVKKREDFLIIFLRVVFFQPYGLNFDVSLGGLIATFYGQNGTRRDAIDGLILNSPYLAALKLSKTETTLINMLIRLNLSHEIEDFWYGRTIHKSSRGEWSFDLKKKPIDKIRIYGAFFSAIRSVQRSIEQGEINLSCPILVMCSNRSIKPTKQWRDEYQNGKKSFAFQSFKFSSFSSADLILDVRMIKKAASQIGSNLNIVEIIDGKHDLFLSKESSREKAFQIMFQWLENLNNEWTKTNI